MPQCPVRRRRTGPPSTSRVGQGRGPLPWEQPLHPGVEGRTSGNTESPKAVGPGGTRGPPTGTVTHPFVEGREKSGKSSWGPQLRPLRCGASTGSWGDDGGRLWESHSVCGRRLHPRGTTRRPSPRGVPKDEDHRTLSTRTRSRLQPPLTRDSAGPWAVLTFPSPLVSRLRTGWGGVYQ